MTEKINEPVEVLVKFQKNIVFPAFFRWRNRTYRIEKVNLVHRERLGENKVYYFSVSNDISFFRLAFSTRDLSWRLEEMHCE